MHEVRHNGRDDLIPAKALQVGQIGEVISSGDSGARRKGDLLMAIFTPGVAGGRLVNLRDPSATYSWTRTEYGPDFLVRPLPLGTTISIHVGK
jgi:hypothetical protein